MRFEFATAGRILFGPGTLAEVPALAAAMGRRAMIVADFGGVRRHGEALLDQLRQEGIDCISFNVTGEPTTAIVHEVACQGRESLRDVVIAMGGGSPLDAGKAIAALLTNEGDLLDYLEVIGRGAALTKASAPCITIPTTAGTGAEVTRNAVLLSPEHRVKVSMRSPLMLPRLAVVDPLLTHTMPPAVTAATGLDALTQLMEAFVCNAPNLLTDGLCREGLQRAARALPRAYENGADAEAREDMSVASLFGGLALANAKLGAVHGFAAPLGGMFPAPHGSVCARLLPFVMAANVRALESRVPGAPALIRYREVARLLTGNPQAKAGEGAQWVGRLCGKLRVPPLSNYGMKPDDIPALVAKARAASSMKGNPIALTDEELGRILAQAI
ncbi:MAG: iron-containing alcohol dehydrogenase [Candidatus Sumerlaeota bacterium]|nr:iron-containing alcohol dehydrogenase [Candidatus Sumerlaeota bacterium]